MMVGNDVADDGCELVIYGMVDLLAHRALGDIVRSTCTAYSKNPRRILLQWDSALENITSQGCGALAKLATSCLSVLLHPMLAQII